MKDLLKYENRDQLYKFLIDDFGVIKVDEKYDPKAFGNFFVTLSAKEFLLRYLIDRSYLTIEIASHSEPAKWLDLSFIKNIIYDPENINSNDRSVNNNTRIEELNSFLRKDFDLISGLFNSENYTNTRKNIDELLRRQFNQKFPGMLQ